MTCPVIAYHLLLPILPDFLALYPEIDVDLEFSDRIADLIEEGVDVAIRSGSLPDSRVMVRTLRPTRMQLCAAPAYLALHGTPETPHALRDHAGVAFRHPNTGKRMAWPIRQPADEAGVQIRYILTCNNMEALHGAVVQGIGVGCMPDFIGAPSIGRSALVPLLTDHPDAPGQFNLIWPSSRHLSPKVRVLVDFLVERTFTDECPIPSAGVA